LAATSAGTPGAAGFHIGLFLRPADSPDLHLFQHRRPRSSLILFRSSGLDHRPLNFPSTS
jgi:hypothetical protein